MRAFPEGFVEEVRRTADIVRFIGEHIALRKVGNSWKGLCPFHQEKTPSFHVRSDPPVFHCFGCGAGGDVFRFVMLHERLSFPEAVTAVAQRFGVVVPERSAEGAAEMREREDLLGVLEAAADWYARSFWSDAGRPAREYLLQRKFERATLERIRVGAARDSWSALVDALRGRYPLELMLKAGLVIERLDGKGHYDRFRNRVVFPILNEGGRPVAFGARALDNSEPKYLNSPETPVYQKSRTLYGLSWAKDSIRKSKRVVLMEGYLDVARAIEKGVDEAVATCGTALTTAHARLLRRFTDQIAINFDQDAAGQKAALRSLDLLVEQAFRIVVVELPEGHDPDSFLRAEGPEAYRQRVEEARPYVEWLIRRSARENDISTPAGKASFLNAILPTLAQIESPVERAAWLPALVEWGGLDEGAAVAEVKRAVAQRAHTVQPFAPPAPSSAAAMLPVERLLLTWLVRGEAAHEALDQLEPEDLQGLRSAPILQVARELAAKQVVINAASLGEALPDDESRRLLNELSMAESPATAQNPLECVRELRRMRLDRRLEQLGRQLSGLSGDQEKAVLLEMLALKRRMAGL
jgi:DNA primase